jgi:hypothetical protein
MPPVDRKSLLKQEGRPERMYNSANAIKRPKTRERNLNNTKQHLKVTQRRTWNAQSKATGSPVSELISHVELCLEDIIRSIICEDEKKVVLAIEV